MKKALSLALSHKYFSNNMIILDNLLIENIKTKYFIDLLKNLSIENGLFVDHEYNKNLHLSLRNVIGCNFMVVDGINPLDIVKAKKIIISEKAFDKIEKRFINE